MLRVSVEAPPSYEFVLSMVAPQRLAAAAGPRLMSDQRDLGHGSDMFFAHLLSVAVEAPAPRDVEAFLAHLQALSPTDLRLRLAGYYVRWFRRQTPADVMRRALRGDRGAAAEFLATSDPEDTTWQAALQTVLDTPASSLHKRIVDFVTRWEAAVAAALRSEALRLRAEVAEQRRLARSLTPAELIQETVHFDYVPEPGIERVVLVPSAVITPERHIFDHQQMKLICYPLPASRTANWQPPAELLSLLGGLADGRRLQILSLLGTEPLSAQQVAVRLGVPITTVIHHLTLLRGSGAISGGGRRRPYAVNRSTLASAARELTQLAMPPA